MKTLMTKDNFEVVQYDLIDNEDDIKKVTEYMNVHGHNALQMREYQRAFDSRGDIIVIQNKNGDMVANMYKHDELGFHFIADIKNIPIKDESILSVYYEFLKESGVDNIENVFKKTTQCYGKIDNIDDIFQSIQSKVGVKKKNKNKTYGLLSYR